jgi:hypothetical protein
MTKELEFSLMTVDVWNAVAGLAYANPFRMNASKEPARPILPFSIWKVSKHQITKKSKMFTREKHSGNGSSSHPATHGRPILLAWMHVRR